MFNFKRDQAEMRYKTSHSAFKIFFYSLNQRRFDNRVEIREDLVLQSATEKHRFAILTQQKRILTQHNQTHLRNCLKMAIFAVLQRSPPSKILSSTHFLLLWRRNPVFSSLFSYILPSNLFLLFWRRNLVFSSLFSYWTGPSFSPQSLAQLTI